MARYRLILVGENRVFREGLKRVLMSDGLAVIHEARSLLAALNLLRSNGPCADLVLYDQPESTPEDFVVLRQISDDFPHIATAIVADHVGASEYDKAVAAGVNGFLPKDISSEALRLALKLIMLDENLIAAPASVSGKRSAVDVMVPNDPPYLRSPLSGRESQILECLKMGFANKVIARKLDMAEATVKVHIKGVLRKINVDNRTQAAIWAINHQPPCGADG